MSSHKKYWTSVEELNENSSIVETLRSNEFVEPIPVDEFLGDKQGLSSSATTRRDFLKYVGFSTAAASLAACEGPVHKAIPYVVQPEQVVPGTADYYATTYFDGFDAANILVKSREGRPIKIENNTIAGAKFWANARVNASVLSLYDSLRLQAPTIGGNATTWAEVNKAVKASVDEAKAAGKKVVVLTGTVASPSTQKLINDFVAANGASHIMYDAVSSSAAVEAFEKMTGTKGLVDYDFAKADVIVSVGADFLGDWQGGNYDTGYALTRNPKGGKMSRHFQFEANMTLSGAAADRRVAMSAYQQTQVLLAIYDRIVGGATAKVDAAYKAEVEKAIAQLAQAGSKGLVVTGLDSVEAQTLALAINQKLNSEAYTTAGIRNIRKGTNAPVAALIADIAAGNVHTLIMNGVNPVYTLANGAAFAESLKKVKTTVTFTLRKDETAVVSTIAAAAPHFLESWGDVEITRGTYSLVQPTIRPLFQTMQFEEALMNWMDVPGTYYDFVRANAANYTGGVSWNKALHDGVVAVSAATVSGGVDGGSAAAALANAKPANGFELNLYTTTGIGDGQQANNPWLQEFPDPLTRVSWDNYLTMAKADADAIGIENHIVADGGLNGGYVTLKAGNVTLENVPVIVQPGQAKGTVGMAVGYGRKEAMKEAMQVGINAYVLAANFNAVQSVSIEKGNGEHEFASVQSQKTLMGRGDIIKETTLANFIKENADVWNPKPVVSLDHATVAASSVDLWTSFDRSTGHHFNMSIDLNSCFGCGACVISCHAENNVPVVGKEEIRRSRDMHWLRIDRYYSSEESFAGDLDKKNNFSGLFGEEGSLGGFLELEVANDNPQVVFQPVMCQHCNHAPCETVCPVAATSHGRQGQNHMAYNRCVGTRYCANNCPYKVRRFNWFLYSGNDEFDFHMNDDLGRMVINPDVNVRSRGVMEKCSMCIQMTQATILKAKNEGRMVDVNEFKTACSSACSTGAIKFGDVNNEKDDVAKLAKDERAYHLLEHIGTKPNVFYHVKVRNS